MHRRFPDPGEVELVMAVRGLQPPGDGDGPGKHRVGHVLLRPRHRRVHAVPTPEVAPGSDLDLVDRAEVHDSEPNGHAETDRCRSNAAVMPEGQPGHHDLVVNLDGKPKHTINSIFAPVLI